MNTSKKVESSSFRAAEREARLLRGEVIEHFAQIERAISNILVHVAALPANAKTAFPHLMGQKVEHLRKLISATGPLKSRAADISPLIDKLAQFEDLRHFLAHGVVDVGLKESGDPIFVFRMIDNRSGKPAETTLALTKREAQSRSARLAAVAKALASELEAVIECKPFSRP